MSKYTTEVRYICESMAGLTESQGFNNVNDIIASARTHIFDFAYPIFDATYKPLLETKILRTYYTREICEETVGLWKLRLCNELNNIMPYYNQLYESALIEFDPFNDVDYSKQNYHTDTDHNAGTSDSHQNEHGTFLHGHVLTMGGHRWDLFSDTPQGHLTGVNLDNNLYISNAHKISDNTTQTHSGTDTTDNDNWVHNSFDNSHTNDGNYTDTIKGKMSAKSYSKLLQEFRETFLNIDLQVINSLSDCFFGLW